MNVNVYKYNFKIISLNAVMQFFIKTLYYMNAIIENIQWLIEQFFDIDFMVLERKQEICQFYYFRPYSSEDDLLR